MGQCLEATGNWQGAHQAYLTCVLIDPANNKEAAARIKALEQSQAVQSQSEIKPSTADNADKNIADKNIADKNTADKSIKELYDQVPSLEAAHNYDAAINMLRQIVGNNLDNPAMHHRLAVDLMSAGEIGEAIAEFRIASALNPAQKTYADDLAQALVINKQALSGDEKGKSQ